MSIEQDLNRIATALEEMIKVCRANAQGKSNEAIPAPSVDPVVKKSKKETAPVIDVDPFAQEEVKVTSSIPTFEELTTLLKHHSVKLGTKVTIALIQRHGADKRVPKLDTIPQASYEACFAEANADLAKLGAKK